MATTPSERKAIGDEHAGTFLATPGGSLGPSSTRYLAGAVLSGKYRLDDLLGEGGMGAVWRATNLLLELPVAIKLIRADLDRSSLRARLQLEARSVAKLGHPGIVRVFDVGESELGDPFIVMELLQGETLASLLQRGRLSSAYAVQLLLPIIDALGTAHSRGIVHRDLKPDNVMIVLEEQRVQPKILDFGIAKLLDKPDLDHKLTEAGTVVGSPDYMSPEQARGREDVDASSDIWSICVVLYEAVTGSAPFSATNYNALLRSIVEDEPESVVARAAGDERLWAIIRRGLAKDRRDRYPSMNELGRALAAWLVSHGVHEDAAGASVESKWLGRSSDPTVLGQRDGSYPDPADFGPKRTLDSHSGATGVGRGPFTATIAPHAPSRKRVLSVAAALGAALVLGAVSFHLRAGSDHSAPMTPTANAALPVKAMAELPLVAPPRSPAPTPDTEVVVASAPSVAPHPTPAAVAPARPPKSSPSRITPAPTSASVARPSEAAGKAAAPVAAPASPKAGDRPLDLLAPY